MIKDKDADQYLDTFFLEIVFKTIVHLCFFSYPRDLRHNRYLIKIEATHKYTRSKNYFIGKFSVDLVINRSRIYINKYHPCFFLFVCCYDLLILMPSFYNTSFKN